MKKLLFVAAMAMPAAAAATLAMGSQQNDPPRDRPGAELAQKTRHRPLLNLKFVLTRPPRVETPPVVMEDVRAQLQPPQAGYPSAPLAASQHDPNTYVCYGRGCEMVHR